MSAFFSFLRTFVLGCGCLVICLQLYLAWLAQHPATLIAWASTHLQTPVQLQSLHADWSAWGPVLRAQGIQLGTGEQAVRIAEVSFAFSAKGPRLAILSPTATLARTPDGWHIAGLSPRKKSSQAWFIQQLSVQNARLHWASGIAPTLHLPQIAISRAEARTQLAINIQHPLGPAHILGELSTDNSQFYAQLPGLPEYPLFIRHQKNLAEPRVQLYATAIPLGPLTDFLADIPLLADWHATIQPLNPTGTLHNVRATWSPSPKNTWRVQAKIADLAVQPSQYHPGLNHIHAEVDFQPDQFDIAVQVTDAVLQYPRLFQAPLNITQFTTKLQGQRDADNTWRLDADAFQLNTPDFTSQGRIQLTLPRERSPHVDIRAQLQQGHLDSIRTYLPSKVMSGRLVNWLNRALGDGQIVQSDLLWHGPLDNFPYDTQRTGVFSLNTQVRAAHLAYHPDWPPLDIERLQLMFNQNSMLADLQAGQLLNSTVKTQAKITQLGNKNPLQLQIDADGPLQDIFTLLQTPKLSENLRSIATRVQANGSAQTQLQLSLPLIKNTHTVSVNGNVQLTEARLQLPGITLEQVTGTLNIRDNQLHADAVQTMIRGQTGQISIQPGTDQTLIHLATRLTPANIRRWLPQAPTQLLHGSAAAQVSLALPKPTTNTTVLSQLQIKSDLEGLQIKLPAPVGKTRYAERPLHLAISLGNNRKPHRLHYGRYWHGLFSRDWQRGELRYAPTQAQLPKIGYRLQGDFQHLDLQAWQHALQRFPRRTGRQPWQLDISATQLQYAPYHVKQAQLNIGRTPGYIRGEIHSPHIIGQAQYDQTQDRLNLYLEKAHIDWSKISAKNSKKRPDPKLLLPNQLPSLRLLCDDLRIDQVPFGQLLLHTESQQQGQTLENIALQGDNLIIKAAGEWQPGHTKVQGSFQAADLGNLLAQLGKPRQLKDAQANGTFELTWPGHPFQASAASLAGQAGLVIGPGRLATVSPGFTRILGLVNVDAFTRRLKLDFADLFKTGYTFDRIQGNFTFGAGQVHTRDLYVDGPTSHIQIGGRIGLVQQDIEQLVYITPKLDGTLLLAGTLAGGPVGTLTSLLVQQLLRRQVNRFSRFEYSITGTWQDPKIMALESGGALSDFINGLRQSDTQHKAPQHNSAIQPAPQRGALQRFIDLFRPTQEATETGWTDEELLNID